ncbi:MULTISPECIES: diacylglycerol/lipid kinase family protein [Marinobacter]|uniref:diacylglycerol/lipid kinase family protein n=1 Tax=Marinobacter TaxID=2742 RepID=UPI000DAEE4D8|nr:MULTISPECIES: diacylglycerol kinase family protein [Marinobacter]
MTDWLIANPAAGDGQRGADFWCEHLARVGIEQPEVCDLDNQAWVERVSADDRVLAAGGDGSVNAAAQICLRTGASLGILPSGTANDFARNLQLPESPEAQCELIASGETRLVDAAEMARSGIFLNVAHVGLGTWPVRDSSKQAKRFLGRFSYAATLLGRAMDKRGFRAVIECESGKVMGRWLSVAIATGAFFGGGSSIPDASADDGQLDIVAVKPRSLWKLFLAFLCVRLLRRSPNQTETIVHLKSPWCELRTRKPKTVTADGEVVGKTPLSIRCRPSCLRVCCHQVVHT